LDWGSDHWNNQEIVWKEDIERKKSYVSSITISKGQVIAPVGHTASH
jgi:hypothetical protein